MKKNLLLILLTAFFVMNSSCEHKNTQPCGTVIIINGTSAVGKSSIIKAFQQKQNILWLGIGIDNFFVGVIPPKFYLEDKPEHHTVMHGIASTDNEGKLFTLHIGTEGSKIINGMHTAIAAYAKAGCNVIVDYITYEPSWRDNLLSALQGIKVFTVGVTASLKTVEAREKARKTSPEGHARSIYNTVHNNWHYNLQINTDNLTADQAADIIINRIQSL